MNIAIALSRVYMKQNRHKNAVELLQAMLEQHDGPTVQLYAALARLHEESNDYERSITFYRKVRHHHQP